MSEYMIRIIALGIQFIYIALSMMLVTLFDFLRIFISMWFGIFSMLPLFQICTIKSSVLRRRTRINGYILSISSCHILSINNSIIGIQFCVVLRNLELLLYFFTIFSSFPLSLLFCDISNFVFKNKTITGSVYGFLLKKIGK